MNYVWFWYTVPQHKSIMSGASKRKNFILKKSSENHQLRFQVYDKINKKLFDFKNIQLIKTASSLSSKFVNFFKTQNLHTKI